MNRLLLLLCLYTIPGYSQHSYTNASLQFITNKHISFGLSMTVSSGTLIDIGADGSIALGAGLGAINFDRDEEFYKPVFGEIGFVSKYEPAAPFVYGRAGYSFYKGDGGFAGKAEDLHGGFFSDEARIAPTLSLTYMQLRWKLGEDVIDTYNIFMPIFGAMIQFKF